jgi:glycosyltransferase involved in cell wall biosynthesis
MRYLWELYPAYLNDWTTNPAKRWLMRGVSQRLRVWDYSTSARVDDFIANSENVQRRILKTYRRDATVIHPPVAVESFHWSPAEDYSLMVSEFVSYKRLDYAVRLFAKTGRKLKVVGDGPEYAHLKSQAGPSVEFCGRVSDPALQDLYSHARALIVPGEEDFGITMVEALASGKPVIALGHGGAREIVPAGGGVLYETPSEERLADALQQLDRMEIRPDDLRFYAQRFSEDEFQAKMRPFLFCENGSTFPDAATRSLSDCK